LVDGGVQGTLPFLPEQLSELSQEPPVELSVSPTQSEIVELKPMLSIANGRPCQKVEKSSILNSHGAALLHKYTMAVV
jgi:hypothetical protein